MATNSAAAGLSLQGVTYRYGPRVALDEVSFEVGSGRFCALLGPNGAGKSTLFALLTGLLAPPPGSVRVAGHDIRTHPTRALACLGVVFQSATLDLDLTVEQNLRYFAALHGLAGREAGLRISAALERLGMAERAREPARALNGGHRRRTEIARALLHGPQVLLLDEPTVGLDAAARAGITAHVHALAREDGLTVLWATHLVDEVAPEDDLIILHQGRVLRQATASDVAQGASLSDVFLGLTGAEA